MNGVPPERLRLLALISVFIVMAAVGSNATIAVHQGERIQAAINSASSGERIEVYAGEYREKLVVDRPIILKGMAWESRQPHVESDDGSAITIKAAGVVLDGFSVQSASGWSGDAGILVLSEDNIIRNNTARGSGNVGILLLGAGNNTITGNLVWANGREGLLLKNGSGNSIEKNQISQNRIGIRLEGSHGNRILGNSFLDNQFEAMNLQESQGNIIQANLAQGSESALIMDGCRDNIVRGNDFLENEKGIRLSFREGGSGISAGNGGVVISYSAVPADEAADCNNSIYGNNLSNRDNARDDSLNRWDDGRMGNNYSDFNDPGEGCRGAGRICDKELAIPGGPSVDRYPQATPAAVPGRIEGRGGAAMLLSAKSYLPRARMDLNYTLPSGQEAWLGLADGAGQAVAEDYPLSQNLSGDLQIAAPEREGPYRLLMKDENKTLLLALPFNVSLPAIKARPETVFTCEKIIVDYSGASGGEEDWIGMYSDSGSLISRQSLGGRDKGRVEFSALDPGSYVFRLHGEEGGAAQAESGRVTVRENLGKKVIAEPAQVSPGGQVTVTFWGASPSGSSVIGMYGITRPDKFDLGKRPTGGRSCGSMVWTLPSEPGTYDFRLFEDDINRNLMAQSNAVTVI